MTLPQMWTKVIAAFKSNKETKDEGHCANEIVYSKNNVCVHSQDSNNRAVHNSGYLTVSCEKVENEESNDSSPDDVTLRLSWVPNTLIYRKVSQIHTNYKYDTTFEEANRKISVESYDSGYQDDFSNRLGLKKNSVGSMYHQQHSAHEIQSTTCATTNVIRRRSSVTNELLANGNGCDKVGAGRRASQMYPSSELTQINAFHRHPATYQRRESNFNCKFTVDLGYVKSLRLFFNQDNDSGQLVITSSENQYKILHFHHGGLEKLSEILESWKVFVAGAQHQGGEDGQLYKHFKICYSRVQRTELLPEETLLSQITQDDWLDMLDEDGRIEDEMFLRKNIFFAGLHKDIRKFVWPFLLNCYPFHSTYEQRIRTKHQLRREYEEISEETSKVLEDMAPDHPFKLVEYLIHKDVIRTDRMHPFYAGDNNPNLDLMKRVLLNYVSYDAEHVYMQGMSDLLAPVLVEIPDEAEAFWCFVDIMKRGLFVCTPTDSDMEKNLMYLRELIRIMHPNFFEHITSIPDGTELLFCHRWLLLCFKREFAEDTVLQMWEACWSNYLTDYFHLFICLAIITTYADNIVEQRLNSDDMLYYFSSLAMSINGDQVLQKARGLIHSFRTLDSIPQCLVPLCQRCGSDMWDSKHIPTVDISSDG